jgi:ribosomal protein S18 acetylase RimI-like enzyme
MDSTSLKADPHIRILDMRYDLDEVADLIEICFAATLDEDGYSYLRQMRKSAQEARMLQWATSFMEDEVMPTSGMVWVENHKIVGNLTLIPMEKDHVKVYLIANVAVLPDYRGNGIGKQLTQAALQYLTDQGVSSAWLQVRDDNPAAQKIYRDTGFIERTRRTTWHAQPTRTVPRPEPGFSISNSVPSDWDEQYRMLLRIYHKDVTWNLPVNLPGLKPTWMSQLTRILYGEKIRGFTLRYGSQFIGSVTWEAARTWADNLWPACDASNQDLVLRMLLPYTLATIRTSRPQAVNYPSGQAEETFGYAGFTKHVTLIWEEAKLAKPVPISYSL